MWFRVHRSVVYAIGRASGHIGTDAREFRIYKIMQSTTVVTVPGGATGSKTSGGVTAAKKPPAQKQRWYMRRGLGHSVRWGEDGRFTLSFATNASPVSGYYGFVAAPQRSMADSAEIGKALQAHQQLLAISRQAVKAPRVNELGRDVSLWGFLFRSSMPNEVLLKFHVKGGGDYYLRVIIDA